MKAAGFVLLTVVLAGTARAAEAPRPQLDALTVLLAKSDDPRLQRNVLRGMNAAL
jgi:hypothetical protein